MKKIIIISVCIFLSLSFSPVNSVDIDNIFENQFEITDNNFEFKPQENTKSLNTVIPGIIWNYSYHYEGEGKQISDNFVTFERIHDGFILLGNTYSFGNGTVGDVWLVKTNEDGIKQWENKISIGEDDQSEAIMVKQGGNYVVVGNTDEEWYSGYRGSFMLSAASTNGVYLWSKLYGDTCYIFDASKHFINDIYLFTGRKDNSIWLMKTNYEGVPIWENIYHYAGMEGYGFVVQWTSDGGSIIAGNLRLNTGDSKYNIILIKIDSNGNMQWNNYFGGENDDTAVSLQQTSDGGYIILGDTYSYGNGNRDLWLIKTDANGDMIWNKTFGETTYDSGRDVKQTSDGGYIVAGVFDLFSGTAQSVFFKTDSNGNIENSKFFDFGRPVCVEEAEEYNQYYCAGIAGCFYKFYLDSIPPDCELINPKNGLYLRGVKILTMTDLTVTIGDAIIDVYTEDIGSGIEKIEIYVNDVLKHTALDPSSSYEWLWHESTPGLYTIKVIAYDNAGYYKEDEVRLLDIF